MLRTGVIFLTLLLLSALLGQANHYLAPLHISLFAGGLFVTYAALRLSLRSGLAAVILGGLLCDAGVPIPPGGSSLAFSFAHIHVLLFTVAFVFIYPARDRMARDETLIRVLVALAANLGLFLALSLTRPGSAALWSRLLVDLGCSQLVLALVAPWFFALQARALALTRTEPVALN